MPAANTKRKDLNKINNKDDLEKLKKFVLAEKERTGYHETRTVPEIFFERKRKRLS